MPKLHPQSFNKSTDGDEEEDMPILFLEADDRGQVTWMEDENDKET